MCIVRNIREPPFIRNYWTGSSGWSTTTPFPAASLRPRGARRFNWRYVHMIFFPYKILNKPVVNLQCPDILPTLHRILFFAVFGNERKIFIKGTYVNIQVPFWGAYLYNTSGAGSLSLDTDRSFLSFGTAPKRRGTGYNRLDAIIKTINSNQTP